MMPGGKCGMVHIQPSLGWGWKVLSAMDTHGIDPASSRTHRPLPWCTLERRKPRRSRNTRSHHQCHRSRSHVHRPRRRLWGPPRKKTSVCPRPTLPLEGLELRRMKLALGLYEWLMKGEHSHGGCSGPIDLLSLIP